MDTLHEQLNQDVTSQKALAEGGTWKDDVNTESGRQQSVQSEDSEMPSSSQSGVVTPMDRSVNHSPETGPDEQPVTSNIVKLVPDSVPKVIPDADTKLIPDREEMLTNNRLQYISEDSNQSETSYQSSELLQPEDHEQRMKPIPEEMKQTCVNNEVLPKSVVTDSAVDSAQDETMSVSSKGPDIVENMSTDGDVTLEKVELGEKGEKMEQGSPEKGLSLEDFYMKDTKTLNLNVLAEEYICEQVTTDSEKFHKHDNVNRPSDPYETLSDFIMNEVKSPTNKPLKDNNLLANFKDKFDDDGDTFPKKCLFSDMANVQEKVQEKDMDDEPSTSTSFCNFNNVKRIKIDEDEKNVRMQARLKVNTNKNVTKSDNIRLLSPSDQTAFRVHNEAAENNSVYISGAASSIQRAVDVNPLEDQIRAQNLAEAERAWKKYLEANRSVVVDTFQGQFKSTVSEITSE